MSARGFVAAELRRHRWIAPGVTLAASAALGTALPDLVALVHRVFS